MMVGFIMAELAILAALWAVFIVMMSFRKVDHTVIVLQWWKSEWQLQLVGIALLGIMEAVALILLGTGVNPPLWVFALIFGSIDLITGRWLYLIWKARRESEVD